MSKFHKYAARLDQEFRASREQYEAVLNELNKAEEAVRDANTWRQESYVGQNAYRKATASARLMAAKAKMNDARHTIWPAFERTVAELTRELQEETRKDDIASPDQVDIAALELMKSGVLRADDYAAMLERYDSNPAMLRLVSKYALEAADGGVTTHDRATLHMVGDAARNGRSKVLRSWDDLVGAAMTCAGIKSIGRDYNPRMGAYWDEFASSVLEN